MITTWLPILLAIGALVFMLVRRDMIFPHHAAFPFQVGERVTQAELGLIERGLIDLRRVIVFCAQVEDPADALREAVEYNLTRGVRYTFLVSVSRAQAELHGYFNLFVERARIVLRKTNSERQPEDLVEIRSLGFEWDDHPYVFYQCQVDGSDDGVVAFRGIGVGGGIAPQYIRISSATARTIVQATFADRPAVIGRHSYGTEEAVPMRISDFEFEGTPLRERTVRGKRHNGGGGCS